MKEKENFASLTLEQLNTQLAEEVTRLQKIKFAHALTPLTNPTRIRQARRQVARLKTLITAKASVANQTAI